MAGRRPKASLPEGDDGRTIVSMNVEGMPWYTPEAPGRPDRDARGGAKSDPMTRAEGRVFVWGALKAALLVAGVMCAGLVLFVLFCLHVWFR